MRSEHDDAERPGHRWLLLRRNIRTGELAYYRCCSPEPVPLSALVKVAGRLRTAEESARACAAWTNTKSEGP